MIKIYSTPTCPYCETLKQYLTDHGFKYADVDVAVDEKERDAMIEKSGQIGVPVVEIDGTIIIGFDKERIDEILKIKKSRKA